MKTVAPFQGPIFALILPWASRKAARPRLLTFILSGWNRLVAADSRSM